MAIVLLTLVFASCCLFTNAENNAFRWVIQILDLEDIIEMEETKRPCLGCVKDQDFNDPELTVMVSKVLGTVNTDHKVAKIINAKTQIVAGKKYIVTFLSTNDKECELSWVEQPWISSDPQYVEFVCK